MIFSHIALSCKDPIATEKFYTQHFGFTRARVIPLGDDQIVFIKANSVAGSVYLELFSAEGDSPISTPEGDGPHYAGIRHLAFQVDDVDVTLAQMGSAAQVTLGPLEFDAFIPGWKTAWIADPDGNIVEISQGYVDEDNPPPLN